MTTKPLQRRLFLQGIGGAVIAAPFLGSLAERAAGAAAGELDPKRLIVFFTHYGCLTSRWFPKISHGALTAADYEATSLKALAPHANKLLMVRGVRAMNEWSFTQELGQETNPHMQVMNSYFTCCPADSWSGIGATPAGVIVSRVPRSGNSLPIGGRSLDHICAEQISRNKAPLYMAVGGFQSGALRNFSFSSAGTADTPATLFPPIGTPAGIYENLATLFDAGSGGSADDTSFALRSKKAALDVVRDDLMRLRAQPMSMSDKQKLQAWEQLLDTAGGMVRDQCNADTASNLKLTDLAAIEGTSRDLQKATQPMLALAALSALCDDNRVIFMKFPDLYNFSFLEGVTHEAHGLSHRIGNANMGGAPCVAGVNDMIASIDTWYAEQFAYLVKILDDIPEGAGSLLDNTATVWMQEMSDGNSHNLNNLPILQAGGCAGYFKTGCAINVDGAATDLSQGNSEALCGTADGVVGNTEAILNSTGTPSNLANMPINKYYCTLMNAIGVKAGPDGFAAIGGTEKVTHFGMYDSTTDFIPFLTADPVPPTIHMPGEFEELKA